MELVIFLLNIFILLSIKTRIETEKLDYSDLCASRFLSYYPLKQGLKLAVPGL